MEKKSLRQKVFRFGMRVAVRLDHCVMIQISEATGRYSCRGGPVGVAVL